VPGSLEAIEQAVEERKIERCRCHVRALCRRVSDSSDTQELLQTIVQFGGADILLSTLSLLPSAEETPPAAVLALLNDAMYICASCQLVRVRPVSFKPRRLTPARGCC
jgi:hypothetical protein